MFKNLFIKMWAKAMENNLSNILRLCDRKKNANFIDLGCDDGIWTLKVAKKIGTKNIFGMDYIEKQLKKARVNGVKTRRVDLNKKFPFSDNSFDVVHSNQVIEHLTEVDGFVSEIYRILKPGGYAIVSTENLASWHNVFSLLMGWQPFSMHISKKYHIGNPLSPHFEENLKEGWTHVIIFTYYSLQELFKKYNFIIAAAKGSGYYPLPTSFANIDPYHSHFITIKARKPLELILKP